MGPATPALRQSGIIAPARQDTLIYVSSATKASVYVYSYSRKKQIDTIIGFYSPAGLCADTGGNVWVTDYDRYTGIGYLIEYAHGGKHSIATLEDPNNVPLGCAVDSVTGNLAVVDAADNVAIYSNAQGAPAYYSTTGLVHKPKTIAYDASGNLYIAGVSKSAALLSHTASYVTKYTLKPSARVHGPLRWDGSYLTMLVPAGSHDDVWQYALSGNRAKRIGRIQVDCCMGDYVIGDSILAATLPLFNEASVTKYPSGGGAFLGITAADPTGIAISTIHTRR